MTICFLAFKVASPNALKSLNNPSFVKNVKFFRGKHDAFLYVPFSNYTYIFVNNFCSKSYFYTDFSFADLLFTDNYNIYIVCNMNIGAI